MRKTFLKVALIGLLVGSLPVGFTSCKDYDDDINNLENQTSDLKTKLASVETAIAALPSKADVTAAQAAAVAQAKADLEAVQAKLQAAIDGKADKEEVAAINDQLSNIKGQLETIEALKAEITESMTALDGAIKELNTKAEAQGQLIAGIQAQIGELSEEGVNGKFDDITEQLTALKNAVNDPANGLDALKAEIAKLAEQIQGQGGPAASLEATLRVINGMVTSLRFVSDPTNVDNGDLTLTLYNPVTVKQTPVGPDDEALLFEMKEGERKDFEDAVLVQVSPAGAVLKAEDLSLINSQLGNIDEYVSIKSVEPYTDLLTSRAVSTNGLYKVTFILNPEYDFANDEADEETGLNNFEAATQTEEGKYVRFAIAVSEENEAGERDVMTPYDLVVEGGDLNNQYALNYNVNDTPVADIHNRYKYAEDNSSYMYKGVTDGNKKMNEVYGAAAGKANYTASLYDGWKPVGDYAWTTKKGAIEAATLSTSDDRTKKDFLTVKVGEAFEVAPVVATGNTIYGYYVALDLRRATESDGSERGEWRLVAPYITNLNTVVKGDEPIKLTITEDAVKEADLQEGDVIGFRVWAVNYTGELVDPDGRAFYVMVGEADPVPAASFNAAIPVFTKEGLASVTVENTGVELGNWITANTNVSVSFAMDQIKGDNTPKVITITTGNGTTFTWEITDKDKDGKKVAPYVKVTPATQNIALGGKNNATTVTNFNNIFKDVEVSVSNASIPDGQNYTGTFTIKNSKGRVLQQVKINISKQLPQGMPSGFGFKKGLPMNGNNLVNYVSFKKDVMMPDGTTEMNPTWYQAHSNLSNSFNWGIVPGTEDEQIVNAANYEIYYQAKEGTPGWSIPDTEINFLGEPTYYVANGWNEEILFKTDLTSNIWVYNEDGELEEVTNASKKIKLPTSNLINNGVTPFTFIYSYGEISYVNTAAAGADPVYDYDEYKQDDDLNVEFRTVTKSYNFAWKNGVNVALNRNEAVTFYTTGVLVTSSITGMPSQTLPDAVKNEAYPLKNMQVALSEDAAMWYDIIPTSKTVAANTVATAANKKDYIGIPTEVNGTGTSAKTYYVAGTYSGYTIKFKGTAQDFPTVSGATIDFTFTDGITIINEDNEEEAQTISTSLKLN